jgi:hypothetical protein
LIPLSLTSTTFRRWIITAKPNIPIEPATGAAGEYPANADARLKKIAIGRTVAAMRIPKLAYWGTLTVFTSPSERRNEASMSSVGGTAVYTRSGNDR